VELGSRTHGHRVFRRCWAAAGFSPGAFIPARLLGQGGGAGDRIPYHGTDLASAEDLAGEPLSAAEAAARSIGGAEPGFYLATSFNDAEYFGALHSGLGGKLAVIEYRLTPTAMDSLLGANSRLGPIPQGAARGEFEGQQLFVPTEDFGLFNDLQAGGDVMLGG
jgi:hypothetical protein